MHFGILGPLQVDDAQGGLGGPKPRAVLAVLLLHANEPVSADRLAMALWGEDVPRGAVKTVQVHVSRLRKVLNEPDLLTTTPAGYRLRVGPDQLDSDRFERLVAEGRRNLDADDPEHAADVLHEALALWRGPPLADLAGEPFAADAIAQLEEKRLEALEARLEADVAAGRHAVVVGELQRLLDQHPLREAVAGQLMLALYRCGRQTEALAVYQEIRARLVDLGVEPLRQLSELQTAILRQDPALEPPELPELPAELDPPSDRPLVGRDEELAWLKERWEAVRASSGRIVSVVGERGSGKTRLAAELACAVHRGGYPVLYGSAADAGAAIDAASKAKRPTLLVLDDVKPPDSGVFAAIPVLTLVLGESAGPGQEARVLGPLNLGAVREIARLCVPAGDVDSMHRWLLDASGGNARKAHQLAGRWASAQAAKRVDQAAGQAVVERASLHTVESELAGSVVHLQATKDRAAQLDENDSPIVCPFKGLASFEVADAPYFYGRGQLVGNMVARLVGAQLLGVVGDSGSGKSSLVKAGLLGALGEGVLAGSAEWAQAVIRPGEQPLEALRRAVAGFPPDRRYVLAVDQFEETFTVCQDEAQRAAFLSELVALADDELRPGLIVLAIRADHYGRCAENPELARQLDRQHVLVGPMDSAELRRAVEGPAKRAGLVVEPGLTDALVKEVEDQPGALPLLSTALLELWQHRSGRHLTRDAYRRAGGVSGAVARLAEAAYDELGPDEQRVTHDVMMELVVETGHDVVERRRVSRAELKVDERSDVAAVVEALTARRLLTATEGTIEVAHEALLREWPRLCQWIEDDRERMRVERKLIDAASEWEAADRDEDLLYGRARLAPAGDMAERAVLHLGPTEQAFLNASRRRVERARHARRRRLTIAFSALAAALVAITAIAIVAVDRGQETERQRNLAVSRALALQSGNMLASDPALGLRLAMWGLDTAKTDQSSLALRQAVLAYRQTASVPADDVDANAASLDADGKLVLTGGADGIARLWDPRTRHVEAQLPVRHDAVLTARFSAQGDRIAIGYEDGTLILTDAALGSPRELLRKTDDRPVHRVAFSGDGSKLAAGLEDGTVRVFSTSGASSAVKLTGSEGPVLGVALNQDGSRAVSAHEGGTVLLWDTVAAGAVGRPIHAGQLDENVVALSPDGNRILGVGDDRRVRMWDADTGAPLRAFDGLGRQLDAAAFSRDGSRIATGGRDGVVRVWSTAGGPPLVELRGQGGRIYDVGFGPRSDLVVSAGDDGTVKTWNAGNALAWFAPGGASSIDFAPDGSTLAAVGDDGDLRLYDAASGALRERIDGPEGYTSVDFSPAGDRIIVGHDDPPDDPPHITIRPVAANAASQTITLRGADAGVNAVRFDATGKRMVYAELKNRIAVRDIASGEEVELRGAPKDLSVYDLSFSADGKRVAVVAEQSGVLVWRIDRPQRPERELKGYRGHANAMAFASDGRIVTGGADRTVRVWPAHGDKAIVMRGHTDEVTTVMLTRDETRVLSTSHDGTLRLWDAERGVQLAVLQAEKEPLTYIVSSDAGRLATLDTEGNIKVFDCPVCGSLANVRAAAEALKPRPLSPADRARFRQAAG